MVKLFILMLLLCGVSSCYPPRIVYALDEMHSDKNEYIDVQLLKGSTTSIDAQTVISTLYIKICNNSNSMLMLNKNNGLEAKIDSVDLRYDLVEHDSLPCRLEAKSTKNVLLIFKAEDSNRYLYKSIDYKKGHFLKLLLGFQDVSNNETYKKVIFKPVKTKKLVYESSR